MFPSKLEWRLMRRMARVRFGSDKTLGQRASTLLRRLEHKGWVTPARLTRPRVWVLSVRGVQLVKLMETPDEKP
jgi:hypothetical protein